MKSPENIQKLIHLLSESSKENYKSILANFNFESIDFSAFESWSSKKYTRNCLFKDERFELLLLCWEKGQETSIHDHSGEDCWVYVLEGELQEVFYSFDDSKTLKKDYKQSIGPHKQSFMNDKIGYHRLCNCFNGKSMTLHLYAKPIERCNFYCERSKQFIEKELNYDTTEVLA